MDAGYGIRDAGCGMTELRVASCAASKEFLTTFVSWCFPSNGRNSRMHTSKLLEFTFSNQTYMASSGFVSRVYLADTNT